MATVDDVLIYLLIVVAYYILSLVMFIISTVQFYCTVENICST